MSSLLLFDPDEEPMFCSKPSSTPATAKLCVFTPLHHSSTECKSIPTFHNKPNANKAVLSARKATVVPLREPITLANGEVIKELPINKNQTVFVGIETVNRDPEIWGPDAEEWIPERWIEGVPQSVNTASVPGAFSNT